MLNHFKKIDSSITEKDYGDSSDIDRKNRQNNKYYQTVSIKCMNRAPI